MAIFVVAGATNFAIMAFLLAQVASGIFSLALVTGWGCITVWTFLVFVLGRGRLVLVTLLVLLFVALLLLLPFSLITLIACCSVIGLDQCSFF